MTIPQSPPTTPQAAASPTKSDAGSVRKIRYGEFRPDQRLALLQYILEHREQFPHYNRNPFYAQAITDLGLSVSADVINGFVSRSFTDFRNYKKDVHLKGKPRRWPYYDVIDQLFQDTDMVARKKIGTPQVKSKAAKSKVEISSTLSSPSVDSSSDNDDDNHGTDRDADKLSELTDKSAPATPCTNLANGGTLRVQAAADSQPGGPCMTPTKKRTKVTKTALTSESDAGPAVRDSTNGVSDPTPGKKPKKVRQAGEGSTLTTKAKTSKTNDSASPEPPTPAESTSISANGHGLTKKSKKPRPVSDEKVSKVATAPVESPAVDAVATNGSGPPLTKPAKKSRAKKEMKALPTAIEATVVVPVVATSDLAVSKDHTPAVLATQKVQPQPKIKAILPPVMAAAEPDSAIPTQTRKLVRPPATFDQSPLAVPAEAQTDLKLAKWMKMYYKAQFRESKARKQALDFQARWYEDQMQSHSNVDAIATLTAAVESLKRQVAELTAEGSAARKKVRRTKKEST
ncbi:hypothetical protein IWQ60_001263 [Tieghemiomyces parasiticus]|uniref:Uncharacterized protein n=1 Tax=Tieghemiomyces parasiticus TaxID=78921 RepID=A0A9W8AJN1_9FUNG|nr:hypothetical protein IWQ60_001263 [Tieghemiomyces parasiticus]